MPPVVLITGATDGIGLALARLYEEEGARPVLHGRRALADLDDPIFTAARYCRADLTDGDAAERVATFLTAQGIERVDVLVHNAGAGSFGPIRDDPPQQIEDLVAVNLAAPIALTRALAGPLEAARGKVVFVSSVVADLPCADYAVYGATKAALDGFARSLSVEWAGRVQVQVVHPGAVRTAFHAKAAVPAALVASPRIPSAAQVAASIRRLAAGGARMPTVGTGNAVVRWIGRRGQGPLDRLLRRRRRRSQA